MINKELSILHEQLKIIIDDLKYYTNIKSDPDILSRLTHERIESMEYRIEYLLTTHDILHAKINKYYIDEINKLVDIIINEIKYKHPNILV